MPNTDVENCVYFINGKCRFDDCNSDCIREDCVYWKDKCFEEGWDEK